MRFENILVHVGPESTADALLNAVATVAQTDGARVTLMSVAEELPQFAQRLIRERLDLWEEQFAEERNAWLARHAAQLADQGIAVETVAGQGSTAIELIRQALRGGHDLVVKASGPDAVEHDPVGQKLLRKCPCAVWLLARGLPKGRVLAAVDLDPEDASKTALNRRLVQHAAHLAGLGGAELHVLHAWRPYGETMLAHRMKTEEFQAYGDSLEALLTSDLDRFLAEADGGEGRAHGHLIRGPAEEVIPTFVKREGIDLVVMGTVGRTGLPGLLVGNTAERILERVRGDLVALKPEGFVSPVSVD